jgi:hypothetical protein
MLRNNDGLTCPKIEKGKKRSDVKYALRRVFESIKSEDGKKSKSFYIP